VLQKLSSVLAPLFCLLVLVGSNPIPAQAQSFIAITKEPLIVQEHFSDAPEKDLGPGWASDDGGNTYWSFTCEPVLDGDIKSEGMWGNEYSVEMSLKRATIKVGLSIQIFLGEHPTPAQIGQQESYASICKRLYANAEDTAQTLSIEAFSDPITARGANREEAVNKLLSRASAGYVSRYFVNTAHLAQRVGRAYDLISTRTTLSPERVVSEAFELANKKPFHFNRPMRRRALLRTTNSATQLH
jgi:hypothetical protein